MTEGGLYEEKQKHGSDGPAAQGPERGSGSPAGHRHCFPAFGAETGRTGKKSLPADGSGQPAGAGAPGSHPEIPGNRCTAFPRFCKDPFNPPAVSLYPEAGQMEQAEGEDVHPGRRNHLPGRFHPVPPERRTPQGTAAAGS